MGGKPFTRGVLSVVVCTLSLFALATLSYGQQKADLILHNAKVVTVDKNFTMAQAVAVTGNTITAVGSEADVMKLAGPNTMVIDLKGRTVVPGNMDTHHHYSGLEYGGNLTEPEKAVYRVDWRAVKTKEDVLNQISGIIKKYNIPPGQWIHFDNELSFGGEATDVNKREGDILFNQLNRWELDKASPNNPIVMSEGIPEYNGLLINGVAMDILWKEYGDFIKANGRYWIDATGRPDGHLESVATRPVMMKWEPQPSATTLAPLFRMMQEELVANGQTLVSGRYPVFRVAALKLLESEGQLLGRTAYGFEDAFGVVTDIDAGLKKMQGMVGSGDDKVWVSSIAPSSVDGSGSRMCTNGTKNMTGAIDNLYPMGQCYQDGEYKGAAGHAAPIGKNYYHDWLMASAKYGIRFANTHMSGDRSNNEFIKTIAEAQKLYGPNATKNWASDHCVLVNPADLPEAGKLHVVFSCYSNPISNGAEIARDYGDKVAQTYISPVKSMIAAGIHPAYEQESSGVWQGLSLFMTRKDRDGKVWGPQERLSHEEALKMTTIWAAEYVLKPDKLGSIEKGKLADMAVLDKDYMTISDEDVAKIQPQVTIFDGQIVYIHKAFQQEYNLNVPGAVVSTYKDLTARKNGQAGNGG